MLRFYEIFNKKTLVFTKLANYLYENNVIMTDEKDVIGFIVRTIDSCINETHLNMTVEMIERYFKDMVKDVEAPEYTDLKLMCKQKRDYMRGE